jgi:5-formyltetrahydrofolate cyclo-ligase
MSNEGMSVRLLKRQLRREIQQSLKQLTDSEVIEECSYTLLRLTNILATRCARRLFQLPQFNQSRNVSIYLSMPSGELQTTSILEKAFQSGCTQPVHTNSR